MKLVAFAFIFVYVNIVVCCAQYFNCYSFESDTEYYGNDLEYKHKSESFLNCCISCSYLAACNSYTYIDSANICILKNLTLTSFKSFHYPGSKIFGYLEFIYFFI